MPPQRGAESPASGRNFSASRMPLFDPAPGPVLIDIYLTAISTR